MMPRICQCGLLRLAVMSALGMGAGSVHAFSIDTGNPDFNVSLNNTFRYAIGMRAESIDDRIYNNPNYDESTGSFEKGDIVLNRVDLLSELEVVYKNNFGFRVSGAAWYDKAYDDREVNPNPELEAAGYSSSYDGDSYSSHSKRFHNGPSAEVLDAFVFGTFNLGDTESRVRIGRHATVWGVGMLFPYQAISYSQNPSDGRKAAANPGIETQEVFLPVGGATISSAVSTNLTLSAQYFYDWEANRAPEGGTFLAPADFFFDGPDQFPLGPGLNVRRADPLEPEDKGGDFGLAATYWISSLGTEISGFYRKFDDRQAWGAPQVDLAAGTYRLVYAEDVELYGISADTTYNGISFGAEVSYRKDTPLNTADIGADNQGARGNSWHALVNAVGVLPSFPLYDAGTYAAELAYGRLDKVTKHEELFNGEGYGGCAAGNDKSDGCATDDVVGLAVNLTPEWYGVFPSVDLSMPMSINYGVHGNGATLGGGNEGSYRWAVGLEAKYRSIHTLTLRYADSHADGKYGTGVTGKRALIGGNGSAATNDRGWVSLTLKTQF